jgi:hypothetical protein
VRRRVRPEKLDCSIPPDRLRGKDANEMERPSADARDDAATSIDVTLGEYMPMEGSEVASTSTRPAWWLGRSRFGVELDPAELREGGAPRSARHVSRPARPTPPRRRSTPTDLSGIDEFLAPDYGVRPALEWAKNKF